MTSANADLRPPDDPRAGVSPAPRPVPLSPSSLPPPPAPLGYAEVPSQFGLLFERRPGGLTIGVPPPWWAAALSRNWILAILGVNVVANVVFAVAGTAGGAAWLLPAIMMLVLVGVALLARSRLPRREPQAVRFDVDGDVLRVRWSSGEDERDVTCTRDEIVSLRGDLPMMGLTIRIRRREIIELMHNRPKVLRVWIAAALRDALRIDDGSRGPGSP